MSEDELLEIKENIKKEYLNRNTGQQNGSLIALELRLADIYVEHEELHKAAETYRFIGWQYFTQKEYPQALQYFTLASEMSGENFSKEEKRWLYYRMHECQQYIPQA
ncbi:MAG: hypothetical protein ABIJ21_04385 [Nanoarchaeota archaeon]